MLCVCVDLALLRLRYTYVRVSGKPLTIVMHADAVTLAHIAFNKAKIRSNTPTSGVIFQVVVVLILSTILYVACPLNKMDNNKKTMLNFKNLIGTVFFFPLYFF